MTKLSLHVGDKGHPFAPQALAPNSLATVLNAGGLFSCQNLQFVATYH